MKVFFFLVVSFNLLFSADFYAKNYNNISTKFKQIITNDNNKKIEYNGYLYIENKSNILWKYKKPIEKNIYINPVQVVIEEPELEQAIISSLNESIDFNKILTNAKKLKNDIYISTYKKQEYKLHISNELIKKISYSDDLGNNIEIYFFDTIFNPSYRKNFFVFNPPSYYDIIYK